MTRARYLKGAAAAIAVLLVLLWAGGLVWFARLIPDKVEDPETVTDAIVVLTGGSLRIESGFRLLAVAKAKVLFITGVHPGVDVADLLRKTPEQPAAALACCVVLGHAAASTLGNAEETAAFMRQHDFHSLRLVTASYHMPRSLFEFARAMPQIRIVPNPVFPALMERGHWWARPKSAALVASEYVKYLVARLRSLVPGAP
jgi:uncharacterized SAM-binding protein YcdF (DUF218 family)